MQGRPDRNRSDTTGFARLNGTGKVRAISQGTGQHRPILTSTSEHRAIPQRPPDMPHLDVRPETPRVPRPQRQPTQPRRMRPRLVVLGAIAAILAIIIFVIVSLVGSAITQSSGPATIAADFLSSLSSKSYDNAYQDLGPAVTIRLNRQEFTQQAQDIDQRYGVITNYVEVDGSATVNNNVYSYTYTITRANLSKPYKLTITLQQDQGDNNTWKVVAYGTTLGPT